jgi:septum formation protein
MLILASVSPRRCELLAQAGLAFTVEATNIPEERKPNEAASAFVLRLAEQKAKAVWTPCQSLHTVEAPFIVLAADTCVLCNGEILGKPVDQADARRMLELLSGRTHQVLTGVAVMSRGECLSDVEVTQVTFNRIAEHELIHYLASGEPMDKAGAYGIQGYAARWIPRIEGCFYNVVGLPVARTLALLAEAQYDLADPTNSVI